ncbi:hypothetical protein FDP08_02290 [Marinobacter panjinensis]|uniref:PIN domain-containing protein n=1 Tax=Marinobacter panjinensis TaxID=2576384 RepID=A0A4U6R0W3_9GAMM|nr:hypothetical protein [Marinobacter panjinensis]MCR8916039.1 hypothetical protein [Marinobacter panjinensis]TKV66999.1 hypothetical protein FDP08_02290 [Marinobacter panjinensis]
MSNYASFSIPKPKNWQDFENNTCILFQCILNDPNTGTHGRTGQSQKGVDIIGRRERQDNHWVGVQCKQKSESQEVTKSELEKEVLEAKKFRPSLTEFILVTTAPDDQKIQKVAREITEKHQKAGLFSVDVWGWGTLEREIAKYPLAINAFHPDLNPYTERLISLGEQSIANQQVQESKHDQMLELLQQMAAQKLSFGEIATDKASASTEAVDQNIHSEIDGYRDLIQRGKARTAKDLLEALKARIWESASERIRFRIVTNIGACQLELGEEKLAADSFLEAQTIVADDPVGLANVALAYLILKEPENAISSARTALASDPANAAAASYLIAGHIHDESVSDPLSLVSDSLQGAAEVLASAINFYARRDDPAWRDLARSAALKHADQKHLQRRAAEAVLDQAMFSQDMIIGAVSGSDLKIQDLRDAVAVLQSLWNESFEAEGNLTDSSLPHNLSVALWGLRETEKAALVLDQALERCVNTEELRELRAALYLETGDLEAAQKLIDQQSPTPGLIIMLAQTLASHDPKRARDLIEKNDFRSAPEHQRLAADQLIVESFVNEGQHDIALERAKCLVNDYPFSIIPLIEVAKIQRKHSPSDSDLSLSKAISDLGNESRFAERFMLAKHLEEIGRYDDVIAVIKDFVDTNHDSPALRLLVYAYINADRRAAAHALLDSLSTNLKSKPAYLKALVAVNANRKDFHAALEALDQYLQAKPGDLEMRLRWFQFCLRLNKQSRVQDYLASEGELLSGSPEQRIELAHWLSQFGFEQRALKLAYSIFLYNSGSPEVHLRYVGLLLAPGKTDSIPLDSMTVRENVAFEIDDGRGRRLWFVIEPEEGLRKDETYIPPENDIAQRAIGLSVGDLIEWEGSPVPWKVLSIKHKYLHALHRSMENYERLFPTSTGLRQVGIDLEAEEPFKEVIQSVKSRHDHVNGVYELLDEKSIPIHVAASALNADIIEVRHGLQKAGRKHKVCTGTAAERMQAFKALEQNQGRGCVVDALTLDIIRRLAIENVVETVCGPISITGSTRDVYWSRLKQMQAETGPSMSIHWEDGELVRQEFSREEWDDAIKLREEDLAWIDNCAEIIPAEGSQDPTADLLRLNEAIGQNFIDDMVAAEGSGRLLLCQDQAYRVLGEKSLGVTGAWLQPVLMVARDKRMLSNDAYNKAVIALSEIGDQFISIDGGNLIWAAQHGIEVFDRVVRRLGGPEADINSHVHVANNFLGAVWSSDTPVPLETLKQTSSLLENLLRGRTEWRGIVASLMRLFKICYGRNAELERHVVLWLKGHFLIPFK